MSLRRDVHVAFEQIAPPLGGMPERVVQTVLAEHTARRRKERMLLRFRTPLSLVAVFLLIALVAAVLIGGRLVQDWNASHRPVPAGQTTSPIIAELEARPLQIPVPKSLADCVTGPNSPDGDFGFGSGPVFVHGGPSVSTKWGVYFHVFAYARTKVTGPVLIRGVELFGGHRIVFVGPHAAGPSVGTDTVDGTKVGQHTEAVVDTSATAPSPGQPWDIPELPYAWPLISALAHPWSASNGWQIDGPDFTETFLVC